MWQVMLSNIHIQLQFTLNKYSNGNAAAVSVHVGDVEVNFRPRNYKMSESVCE